MTSNASSSHNIHSFIHRIINITKRPKKKKDLFVSNHNRIKSFAMKQPKSDSITKTQKKTKPKYLKKREILAEVSSELSNAVDGDLGGVIKIINSDNTEAREKKLKDGVAADVSSGAGDEDGDGGHGRSLGLELDGSEGVQGSRMWKNI